MLADQFKQIYEQLVAERKTSWNVAESVFSGRYAQQRLSADWTRSERRQYVAYATERNSGLSHEAALKSALTA